MSTSDLPANSDLIPIVVAALKTIGGSGTNDQIRAEVIKAMSLTPEVSNKIHSGSRTELEYKLAWARTLAKQKGLIVNEGRMTWKISQ
jgi:restriction system protein